MQGSQPRPNESRIRQTLEAVRRRLLPFVPVLLIMPFLAGLTAAPANAVYNGVNPDPSQFEFVVKLLTTYPDNQHEACTGSLISSDIVVTDAHCVKNPRHGDAVSVAATFHAGQFGAYTVTAHAFPNRNYSTKSPYRDDIALLVLNTQVNEPTIPLASTEPPVGAQVVQAGYGCPDDPLAKKQPLCYVDYAPSWQLKGMTSLVGPDSLCAQYIDPASQICTFSQTSSINSGDSGGPVIWLDNGVRKLVGLNEGHPPRTASKALDAKYRMMSTSVAYELNWIQTSIANIHQKPAGPAHLYWTDRQSGAITKSNLDGSGATQVVTGQNDPSGIAAHSSGIYWINHGDGSIAKSNPDGTGVTTLLTGQTTPWGLAVDASHIYWTNFNDGVISRANLDGTGVTTLVTGQTAPGGLAVDASHIYWSSGADGTISRANLDGTSVTTVVTGQNGSQGVALDSGHVYWVAAAVGTINRANLDGTGVMALVKGQYAPYSVAVDSGHIYWTGTVDGTIHSANLDGTSVTTLVTGQAWESMAVGP
ncbi:trypsin-like serine protease [Pseudarthrobacter phenanthrenivorans]|uniref:trypsin-like serine protease n=1 Tax=Pseudarthrobacter phenanthrenivorans TaxID=361575 RepID=UPI00344B1E39